MKRLALALCLLLALPAFAAEPTPAARAEIAYLFEHLGKSGCRFNRNGSWYDARDAVAHLQKKYDYLLKKKLVTSSEDFIARGASESSMSGKPYLVQCGAAAPATSADWFRQVLARYRQARP
jgi:hypothetical protein